MSADAVRQTVKEYIRERFMIGRSTISLSDADDLLEKGILDSTGILELVGYIEENFEFPVEDEELIPNNLGSIDNIVNYIVRKAGIGI